MMEKKFLTVQDTCELLTVSQATLYRIRKSGQFPREIQISPGRIGFRLVDVEAYMDARGMKSVSSMDRPGGTNE